MVTPTPLQVHEATVQAHAERYRVAAFRGSGVYAKGERDTFEDAVSLARKFYTDRPVPVYAVFGLHQSHVVNVDPKQELLMSYLVSYDVSFSSPQITRYASTEAARAALTQLPGDDRSALVVTVPEDLDLPGPTLVRFFNALTPAKTVERFATRADGQRRLFEQLTAVSAATPVLSAPVAPPGAPPAKRGKGVKTRTGKRGFPKEARITVLAPENPKKKGSAAHERFAKYHSNMTVAAALEAGLTAGDFAYDVKHGYVVIK